MKPGFGKILLVGGYSILERPNRGIVLSVSNAWTTASIKKGESKVWTISIKGETRVYEKLTDEETPGLWNFVIHALKHAEVNEPLSVNVHLGGLFSSDEKYGLGSSAAVTTAVLSNFYKDPHELFRRSYRAHNDAQGKIGSGFDVASSIFGTIEYSRPDNEGKGAVINPLPLYDELEIKFYNIKGMKTSTKVAARSVISQLGRNDVRKVFDELSERNNEAVDYYRKGKLKEFLEVLKEINILRKELGGLTGVPIEPPEFDKIRKDIENRYEDVVTVLPGAGGYDGMVIVSFKPAPDITLPEQFEEVNICLRQGHILI